MTADATGKYTGSTTITVPVGTYDIYVKGPVHLRKKFAGQSIVAGANNLDFSAIALLAGDVQVDNTIQLSDLTAMISVWTQSDTPVTPANSLYDLDGNGLISLSDLTTIISNWTTSIVNGD